MESKGLKAHDALSDVKATIGIFKAQYADRPLNTSPLLTDDGMLSIQDWQIHQGNALIPDCLTEFGPEYDNTILKELLKRRNRKSMRQRNVCI